MADRLAPYDQRRPWTVPDSLDELCGPTHGVVELPLHLDWSEQRSYDLGDPAQLGLMYERMIREAMIVEDLRRYLHGPTLRSVWRRIFLPRPVRAVGAPLPGTAPGGLTGGRRGRARASRRRRTAGTR